jgi:glycerol dehydrogenase
MYTPDGAFDRPWFFPQSPALVVVDSGVIARSPLRHLVAGMGDAMSTCYEVRTCFHNPKARNMVGGRPTAAAFALAELAATVLFKDGVDAVEAAKKHMVNDALENVIEANTLLSGIGFESGGLAASHGIAQVFPAIPFLHEKYMHGEMVAIGLLGHQCLEGNYEEARRLAEFFAAVGLPVHLGQLSLDIEKNSDEMDLIYNEAANVFFIHHEPFEISIDKLKKAMTEAHTLGLEVSAKIGDLAYKELHSGK